MRFMFGIKPNNNLFKNKYNCDPLSSAVVVFLSFSISSVSIFNRAGSEKRHRCLLFQRLLRRCCLDKTQSKSIETTAEERATTVSERETVIMIMGEDREIQMGGELEIKLLSFSCSVPFVNSPVVFSF